MGNVLHPPSRKSFPSNSKESSNRWDEERAYCLGTKGGNHLSFQQDIHEHRAPPPPFSLNMDFAWCKLCGWTWRDPEFRMQAGPSMRTETMAHPEPQEPQEPELCPTAVPPLSSTSSLSSLRSFVEGSVYLSPTLWLRTPRTAGCTLCWVQRNVPKAWGGG